MSDMPRPRPPTPAAAHEQHDTLLVAQHAAGDPLEGEQGRLAQQLVATCGACAELATDLRAVSGAVAWEPVPPRRRDFRIDPAQAEQLRGNALTRWLHGLSLPRSAAFRPAAAGLMSIGLAFAVVGYAWPEDGAVTVEGESNVVPAAVEERAVSTLPPFEELLRSQAGAPMFDEADPFVDEPEPLATELEARAAEAEISQPMSKSVAETGDDRLEEGLADWADSADSAAGAVPETPVLERGTDADGALEPSEDLERDVPPDGALGAAAEADEVAPAPGGADVAVAPETAATTEAVAGDLVTGDDSPEAGAMLLAAGLVLAVLGAALLLLAWLARRETDPLLR